MAKNTILCAIDFSESSIHALKWAMSIAPLYQAHVAILFCYRLIPGGEDGESANMKKNMEAKALLQFKDVEKKLSLEAGVPYQFIAEVGFFPSRIEMFIRKSPVSLLVIGSSLVSDFNEYKSLNLDQFLAKTKVPVVIVPEEASELIVA